MNRREFIGGAAGALLAAQAIGQTAASSPIPCGVLGLGHAHAMDIVKVLRASPDFTLAGVCEPEEAMRTRYANEEALQGVAWLSQEELLGNPDIKMVAVESNVARLLTFGRAVVDAGKHLHMDKPAGTSLSEFRGLLDSAKRQALLVQMGYMFRYNPGFDFVRKMVAEGRVVGQCAFHPVASMSHRSHAAEARRHQHSSRRDHAGAGLPPDRHDRAVAG